MAANRRLLKELAAHQADPNPALQMLEPESEEDMLTWVAILKGPTESAYHGKFWSLPHHTFFLMLLRRTKNIDSVRPKYLGTLSFPNIARRGTARLNQQKEALFEIAAPASEA